MTAIWEDEAPSQSALAERLGIQPATLTVALRSLEGAGFVKRERDQQDQRVVRVSATPKGMALRSAVLESWDMLEARTVEGLTGEEKIAFDRLLTKVCNGLQKDDRTSFSADS